MNSIKLHPSRLEVMNFLGQKIDDIIEQYLKKIDENWQPTDFLPESNRPEFTKEILEIQEQCKELPYEYMAILVGDLITEEALPTYESWLMDIEGVSKLEPRLEQMDAHVDCRRKQTWRSFKQIHLFVRKGKYASDGNQYATFNC